ncbi:tyrosine-type recombinase/integrase [Halorubrum ezzemoulense]|uniref:Tyrosine-type recombinase/integrase n=1 Tax=Halorubrum ezzemoulense TaxID=337243 RepID=A0ABT4Z8F1_HALEZ|nr:tyrosine-type recombinase/integrase [Halorubrum ezzemoulense]MDB2294360.1 tyrosine-type recombinase/integrase [Halorubrum ezzemoulense]
MFDAFEEYLDYLKWDQAAADATIQKREQTLRKFSTWLRDEQDVTAIESVSRRDIGRYVDYLVEEGYAPNTITAGYYSSVSAVFNWAHSDGVIDENPIDRLKRQAIKKRAREALSEEEKKNELGGKDFLEKEVVYELAEHAPEPSARNELLIKLMFWTGVRVSELVGITIGDDGQIDGPNSDIDPEEPRITVYAPKTDKPRVVSYPRSEINPLMRDWVSHGRLRYKHADELNYLFIGHKGEFTKSGVADVVTQAAENAGLQEIKRVGKDGKEYNLVTPHLLRHSHAMYYHNEEGVPLDRLKDHLGHHSVDTTERFYAENTPEKMVDTFGE